VPSQLRPPFLHQNPEPKPFHSLQGALDGGLDIPHSEKRFVGYDRDGKSLDAEMLHKFIYGGHVADYMNEMQARVSGLTGGFRVKLGYMV